VKKIMVNKATPGALPTIKITTQDDDDAAAAIFQTRRPMSADTIGQNKVAIKLYCRQWQLLMDKKWQKGRRHDDGRQTKAIHMTIKQRSRGGSWQWQRQ
jgi:hypothetical protein